MARNVENLMNDDIELGWLRLTNKTQLVLTTRYVFQQQDYGIFGENRTIIPRGAITTVRLGWQRSRWAMLLGFILLVTSLALFLGNHINQSSGIPFSTGGFVASPSTLSLIQYGLTIGGLALFALFWFHKRSEVQVVASTGSIGGTPLRYEDADEFCLLLVGASREPAPTAPVAEPEAESSPSRSDPDWRL
jgi:hypothetical protein